MHADALVGLALAGFSREEASAGTVTFAV